jgi:ribonuclease R
MGDALKVKLMEAAPLTGGLRFELADGAGGSASPRRKAPPGRPGKRPEKARFQGKKR